MNKLSKLSSLLLSALIPGIIVPEVTFAQNSANEVTENNSEQNSGPSLPPSSEIGAIFGHNICEAFSELETKENMTFEDSEVNPFISNQLRKTLSIRYEDQQLQALYTKLNEEFINNPNDFYTIINNNPYLFTVFQKVFQEITKDQECFSNFINIMDSNQE